MPHTTRVEPALARYLLAHPDPDLRRRVAVLHGQPFPPGSRALAADAEWHALGAAFPGRAAFVYGTAQRALLYTYRAATETLIIVRAVVDGVLRS